MSEEFILKACKSCRRRIDTIIKKMVTILSKFTVLRLSSYFVVSFLKSKLILFYNRIIYYFTRIYLILLPYLVCYQYYYATYPWNRYCDWYISLIRVRLKNIFPTQLFFNQLLWDPTRLHFSISLILWNYLIEYHCWKMKLKSHFIEKVEIEKQPGQ